MIKNKIHYQITGDFKADFGTTVSNPIIKIAVSDKGVIADGLLKCEYNVYVSADAYNAGKYFFKAEKEDKRLINFTYPIADVPNWSFATYAEDQRKIIADTFGYNLANVVLVEEAE
jgi:hypothetical protein